MKQHYHCGENICPNSGHIQNYEEEFKLLPRIGWVKASCHECGENGWVFVMISSGGSIKHFWGEGHRDIPAVSKRFNKAVSDEPR